RILHQRLQQEARQKGCACSGAQVPMKCETAGVALLENPSVVPQPVDLIAQCLHLALVAQRIAQEVTERGEQPARRARLLGGQSGDGVERVEQEVRLEM